MEETEYLTDAFTREAVSAIKRHKSEPFFLYLACNAPHTPFHASEKHLASVAGIGGGDGRRTYAAMVKALDEGVGSVLAKLEELELSEKTLVIFTNDTGPPFSFHFSGSHCSIYGCQTRDSGRSVESSLGTALEGNNP